jgi:single-stranded DNA-binding protein
MISILIEGKLHADPVRRTSAKGQAYITAQMRAAGDDGETVWCSLIAFDAGAVEALGKLAAGDTVAVAGHASLSTWQSKDGDHKAGLKLTVNRVMSVYEAGKRRGAASNGGNASHAPGR